MAEPTIGADVRIALGVAAALTIAGLEIGDPMLSIVLTLVVFAIVVYSMFRVPLRYSLMALTFFALVLPNPIDGTPVMSWHPPALMLGAIMLTHINTLDRSITALDWCSFSGMDVCIVVLVLVAVFRQVTGSRIDERGRVATPRPLVKLAYLSLVAPGFAWFIGLVRGGDMHMSLWQLDQVMHLPILFLLFHVGLRGPKDHVALTRVVLSAAAYKSLLALYVVNNLTPPDTGETPGEHPALAYATSHADSMLFSCAFVLILALLLERVGKRARRLSVIFIPLLAAGITANNRRIAWVQVGLVFFTVFFASRDSPLKRRIRRYLLMVSPLAAAYFYVGWESTRSIFKPAQMMRSVVEAQTDASSFWRELENFDLISTIRSHPIVGTGYGYGYDEVIVLPQVEYSLERYAPHNGILGLWSFCGIFGYTALTLLWVVGVYFAMRSYYLSTDAGHRAAGLVSFGAVLIYLIQCWGDLGLGSWTGVFIVAPALAVGGKLASATGAWSAKKAKTRSSRPTPISGEAEQAA